MVLTSLQPLEFSDALSDSPLFRERLHEHELELNRTSSSIKLLIKRCYEVIDQQKNLSKAFINLSKQLNNFDYRTIGNAVDTDDEIVIRDSFERFANLIENIEKKRSFQIELARYYLQRMEFFRKEDIGAVKEHKKKFDKETQKYYNFMEKKLAFSTKKTTGQTFSECDSEFDIQQAKYKKLKYDYVFDLQKVQEKKKFQFVEELLLHLNAWMLFYHQGYEVYQDTTDYISQLSQRLSKCRNNFQCLADEGTSLIQRLTSPNGEAMLEETTPKRSYYDHDGYLFVAGKRTFNTTWQKHYCTYNSTTHRLCMFPYTGHTGSKAPTTREEWTISSAFEKSNEAIDRRFCIELQCVPVGAASSVNITQNNTVSSEVTSNKKSSGVAASIMHFGQQMQSVGGTHGSASLIGSAAGFSATPSDSTNSQNIQYIIVQAVTLKEMQRWIQLMGGTVNEQNRNRNGYSHMTTTQFNLNEIGMKFLKECIYVIEEQYIEEPGIYRKNGVKPQIEKFVKFHLLDEKDEKRKMQINLKSNNEDCLIDISTTDVKTITSGIKYYLRHLKEPLVTAANYQKLIAAIQLNKQKDRLKTVHEILMKLPNDNLETIKMIFSHLYEVSLHSNNQMHVANLSICFGPTILWPQQETVKSLMNIKFCNFFVEMMITFAKRLCLPQLYLDDIEDVALISVRSEDDPSAPLEASLPILAPTLVDQRNRENNTKIEVGNSEYVSTLKKNDGRSLSMNKKENRRRFSTSSYSTSTTSSRSMSPLSSSVSSSSFMHHSDLSITASDMSAVNDMFTSTDEIELNKRHLQQQQQHHQSGLNKKETDKIADHPIHTSADLLIDQVPTTFSISSSLKEEKNYNPSTNRPTKSSNQRRRLKRRPFGASSSSYLVDKLNIFRRSSLTSSLSSTADGTCSWKDPESEKNRKYQTSKTQRLSVALRNKLSRSANPRPSSHGPSTQARTSNVSTTHHPTTDATETEYKEKPSRVIAIYSCSADDESELNFNKDDIIGNIETTDEPGWLKGTLNGVTGLIPENYVKFID
ncbi:hypothetical protein SNEBB_001605 [Seison nebaliae]|nr:hypothetical protein SNEBB_001605 [Seison nebaliae]